MSPYSQQIINIITTHYYYSNNECELDLFNFQTGKKQSEL